MSLSNGLEKYPKLRFYIDSSNEQTPYKHLILRDITFPAGKKNKELGDFQSYSISNTGGFVPQDEQFEGGSLEKADKSLYIIVSPNSFAYNPARINVGSIGYQNEGKNVIISSLYEVFKTVDICNDSYLWHYLNTKKFNNYVGKYAEGGVRQYLFYDNFCRIPIHLPSIDEQNKVSEFLNFIDKKIQTQQQLVELLKKYKKGVTEQIFQQNKNNWNCKKIEEICKIQTGKSNTQDEVENGKFDFYVRSPIVRKSNRFLYDCEAVLTVGDGVGTGKVFHYVNGKFDLHQRVYAMTDFREVSAKYFYFYFSHFFYDRVRRMTAKTSVDSVRYDMISQMDIYIPNQIEQEKIVDLLSAFENKFLIEQLKLQNLELQKKAFLQQLFV